MKRTYTKKTSNVVTTGHNNTNTVTFSQTSLNQPMNFGTSNKSANNTNNTNMLSALPPPVVMTNGGSSSTYNLPLTFYVYVRKRDRVKLEGSFIEFYVQSSKTGFLTWPTQSLPRFENRIVYEHILQVNELGPNLCIPGSCQQYYIGVRPPSVNVQLYICCTSSVAPTIIQKRTKADILSDGFWITYHDTIPKGQPYEAKAVVFGVPIDAYLHQILFKQMSLLYSVCHSTWPDTSIDYDPYVVYHGTSKANVKSIVGQGLKPSFGMLGQAVYFGTFWKAYRFAVRTQDYKLREGSVFRCYAFWNKKLAFRTMLSSPCQCEACKAMGSCPQTRIADHLGQWASLKHYIAVLAIAEPSGPIKNEEYASIDDSHVLLDTVGHCIATTEHHEPLSRSFEIL